MEIEEHEGHQGEPQHIGDHEPLKKRDIGVQLGVDPELRAGIFLQEGKVEQIEEKIGHGHRQHPAAGLLLVPVERHADRLPSDEIIFS